MKVFRYSGSKRRILKYLPAPPFGTSLIVEPFAGSLAFSMKYRPTRILAAEANPLVRGLLEWLRHTATGEGLRRLQTLRVTEKVDAFDWGNRHGLSEPEITLLRLMTSGAYVGQLSSCVLYPQHSLKLESLIEDLPYLQGALMPVLSDYREVLTHREWNRAFALVDPPYLGTKANYKGDGDHGGMVPGEVGNFIQQLRSLAQVLVTYGDGAQETFSDLAWQKAVTRKVPILRGGGTKERTEWFALLPQT